MTLKDRLQRLNIRHRVYGWVRHNHVFGRCQDSRCNVTTVGGVCPSCGLATVCTFCGRVRRPYGTWRTGLYEARYVSHGICEECLAIRYGDRGREILARQKARRWAEEAVTA
jgi:hypothetical protein